MYFASPIAVCAMSTKTQAAKAITPRKINLGEQLLSSLENYVGKPIQIGMRPEHIVMCEDENNSNPADCTCEVIAYENMGNEQLVYLSLAGKTLIIRRSHGDVVEVGKDKAIRFLRDKIIFMDEASGEVIEKQ